MLFELTGSVPGLDSQLAATLISEAWSDIRKLGGWSFQLFSSGFATAPLVSAGTVSIAYGTPIVTGDATAVASWLTASYPGNFLTQRQFRTIGGTIYNIVAFDGVNTLTLDRNYTDRLPNLLGLNPNLSYMIYQPYHVVPFKDWRRYLAVLDVTNVNWLRVKGERAKVDMADPQRQIFSNPLELVDKGTDLRFGTSTPGYYVRELYPHPTQMYTYSTWGERFGTDFNLVAMGDELPVPITESTVKAKARVRAYEWAESNKDPANPRGAGADFRFLIGLAAQEYSASLKDCRKRDRDAIDIFTRTMTRLGTPAPLPWYNQATGQLTSSNLA
jgi:hypothetical protein